MRLNQSGDFPAGVCHSGCWFCSCKQSPLPLHAFDPIRVRQVVNTPTRKSTLCSRSLRYQQVGYWHPLWWLHTISVNHRKTKKNVSRRRDGAVFHFFGRKTQPRCLSQPPCVDNLSLRMLRVPHKHFPIADESLKTAFSWDSTGNILLALCSSQR